MVSTWRAGYKLGYEQLIGLLQRVASARVDIDGITVGAIERGLMVLVGVQKGDSAQKADRLLQRLLGYRVFPDTEGKMNLSLTDTGGGLLLVSQFTLAADTKSGMRAGFSSAAPPVEGEQMFDYLVQQALLRHDRVASGRFGADMQVSLVNDGPVTFWLET